MPDLRRATESKQIRLLSIKEKFIVCQRGRGGSTSQYVLSSTALSQGRRRSFSKRREFSTTRGPQTLHLSVEVHQNSVSLLFSYFEGHVDLVIPLDGDQLIRIVKRREGLRSVRKEAAATELSAEPNCTSAVGYRSSSMVEGLLPSMP